MEPFHAFIRDHMLKNIHSIESHDPYVVDIVLTQSLQQLYKPLEIDFKTDVVVLRLNKCHFGCGLTVTEPNFNDGRVIIGENGAVIQHFILEEKTIMRHILHHSILFLIFKDIVTEHIAFDGALPTLPNFYFSDILQYFLLVHQINLLRVSSMNWALSFNDTASTFRII